MAIDTPKDFILLALLLKRYPLDPKEFLDLDWSAVAAKFPQPHWLRPRDFETIIYPRLRENWQERPIGQSYEGRTLRAWEWGEGATRVLIWAQMHGDETTASQALSDLANFFKTHPEMARRWKKQLKIALILPLNPDGAERRTRRNAQQIDLNRDLLALASPEMQAFETYRQNFDPHWAFNLHDQRSIFSVAPEQKAAVLSFLAPSFNPEREINEARRKSMALIAQLAGLNHQLIPGQIGRYSDEFYPLALGDNLTAAGIPTVLIETAPHNFSGSRQRSRELLFRSLLVSFDYLAAGDFTASEKEYFALPENEPKHRDLIFRAVKVRDSQPFQVDIAIQREWQADPEQDKLSERWRLSDWGDLRHFKAHRTVEGGELKSALPEPGALANLGIPEAKVKIIKGIWQD